jgi:SAM-dependent methyltransferase
MGVELERLADVYRRHHEARRPPDFVFCGPERSELFRDWIGRGRRVLDLGCRSGALTRSYADGNDVVGLDVDSTALAEAAKLGIETVWADANEPLPVADESFDVIVAGELLEHLPSPEQTMAEAQRVLRPHGLLVGSVPNAYRLKNRLRFLLGRPVENDPTHLHVFSPTDLLRLLRGFVDPELRYLAGRLTRLHPRLFANDIAFRARKT